MSKQAKTLGIIGAGRIGKAVAKHAARAGRIVIISNSKGPNSLGPVLKELGPGVHAGTVKEAAEQDLVVIAVSLVEHYGSFVRIAALEPTGCRRRDECSLCRRRKV